MGDKRRKVVLVDDNLTNLTIGKDMLRTRCEVYPAVSAAKMFVILNKITPDLILLDIEMPEMDGYQALSLLKADERFTQIPVVLLTAQSDSASEAKGRTLGAAAYVTKPFTTTFLFDQICQLC
ncbi:MAG: response regulator [Coriobacteriales bacterium]|jgi:putative two-component system response regulator|nr:response regulator [Coriobacteriales bacterium]